MGIRVVALLPGCFAERAGVIVGDIITEVDGVEMNDLDDYVKAVELRELNSSKTMKIKVLRNEELFEIEMALGRYNPSDPN